MGTVPFFSIIMPVYRVERYLSEAVRSILAQTDRDFELILVDDASPDRCPQMCDELAAEDPRITVIHKAANEGLGMARNSGMQQAVGSYVLFVDSDDTVEPHTLQTVRNALDTSADMVVFGMNRVYENEDGTVKKVDPCVAETYEGASGEAFLKLTQARLFPYVCNKAYRREFLQAQAVTFETTKLIEDFLFNIALFEKADSVCILSDCLYHYRKPPHQTLVNTYAPEFFELAKRKYRLERAFIKRTGVEEQALQTVLYSHIKHIFSVFLRNQSAKSLSRRDRIAAIRETMSDGVTAEVLREFVPTGLVQRAVIFLLRHRMVYTCYSAAALLKFIQGR